MTTSTGEGRVLDSDAPQGGSIPADTYAHRLMLARAHAGNLSIRAAAERCGLNHANWANWEQGMRSRSMVEDVQAISRGLGIDRDWLMFGGPLAMPGPTRSQRAARLAALRGHSRAGQIMAGGDVTTQYYGQSGTPRRRPLDSRPAGHPGGVRRPERLTPPIAA